MAKVIEAYQWRQFEQEVFTGFQLGYPNFVMSGESTWDADKLDVQFIEWMVRKGEAIESTRWSFQVQTKDYPLGDTLKEYKRRVIETMAQAHKNKTVALEFRIRLLHKDKKTSESSVPHEKRELFWENKDARVSNMYYFLKM